MSSNLSERVRRSRELQGLSQRELADAVGVSRNAVTEWENGGTKSINSERLHKAAAALGVDAHRLATGRHRRGRDDADPDPLALLPDDERDLLTQYRRADPRGKESIARLASIEAGHSSADTAAPVAKHHGAAICGKGEKRTRRRSAKANRSATNKKQDF